MMKEGAVIIDVGTTRVPDASKKSGFKLTGDVKFDEVAPKCSYITPVPGGVGPMTIVSLMKNTLLAGKKPFINEIFLIHNSLTSLLFLHICVAGKGRYSQGCFRYDHIHANDSLLPHRITLLFAGDLMQHQGQINAAVLLPDTITPIVSNSSKKKSAGRILPSPIWK